MDWHNIKGWLTDAEGRALQSLAAGATVLELGSYLGRSTIAMAEVAERVLSVDAHVGDEGTGPADTLAAFRANLDASGVADRVDVLVGDIGAIGPKLPDAAFDLVFVDSAHDAESVERDARIALRCVRPGGTIAFHDCNYGSVREGMGAAGIDAAHPAGAAGSLGWFSVDSSGTRMNPAATTGGAARPRVALVMPSYGDVSIGAASGFFRPTFGAVDVAMTRVVTVSATPHCMNVLWAQALDARDRGEVTHLAMLHSDIAPAPGWLDVLHREMVGADADAISAVVPFKDDSGRTSTAIGGPDPWRALRYITLAHRGLTPETFTAADVCRGDELLMVNTGCMLLDLRRPWWDVPTAGGPGGSGFAWEFRTRIATVERANPDGTTTTARVPQFAPEDWIMSRHVAGHGGKVAATWAVELEHKGAASFSNRAG